MNVNEDIEFLVWGEDGETRTPGLHDSVIAEVAEVDGLNLIFDQEEIGFRLRLDISNYFKPVFWEDDLALLKMVGSTTLVTNKKLSDYRGPKFRREYYQGWFSMLAVPNGCDWLIFFEGPYGNKFAIMGIHADELRVKVTRWKDE